MNPKLGKKISRINLISFHGLTANIFLNYKLNK